jgi:hypothetical protein
MLRFTFDSLIRLCDWCVVTGLIFVVNTHKLHENSLCVVYILFRKETEVSVRSHD